MEEAIQQTDVGLQSAEATETGAGSTAQPMAAAAGTAEAVTQAAMQATENVPAETGRETGSDENAENSAEIKSFEKGFGIVHESGAGENSSPAEGQKNPGEAASVGTAPTSVRPPDQGAGTETANGLTTEQKPVANIADAVHADAANVANAAPANAVNNAVNNVESTSVEAAAAKGTETAGAQAQEAGNAQENVPMPPRDWNAGFKELAEAHPEIVGQQIPQDIFQELMKSDLPPVRVYEGMMMKKLEAQVKALQQENRTLKQNAEAAARAPVFAQTGAPVQSPKEDPFLKGFNAWMNDRR